MLNPEELERYERHLRLPGFGIATQEKLKSSKMLVVGAGGLGAPILSYLTAAGVGEIGIIDHDYVDLGNLQRQILFGTDDVGRLKVDVAIERLRHVNPNVFFRTYNEKISAINAIEIIEDYDIIIDGSDNFPTRYLVNDACVLTGKPLVYGSVYQFEGQVSVFNYLEEGKRGPNYRDLFPEPPSPGMVPDCAEGGVLGVLPGLIGTLQALEAIKIATRTGSVLSGKLLVVDAFDLYFRKLNISRDSANPLTGDNPVQSSLIDYEAFCGISMAERSEISPTELHLLLNSKDLPVLIDVREPSEYEQGHLNSISIPVSNLYQQHSEIPKSGKVILLCRTGARSGRALDVLKDRYGFKNLINLKGGLQAWKKEVDPGFTLF